MEIQMNDNSIVEMLETIFSNVNSWLNFAEAKNAALMAFNIVMLAVTWGSTENAGKNILFYGVNLAIVISTIIALKSFKPDKGKCKEETGVIKENDNLLFYEDIAKYSKESYLIALYKKYQDTVKTEDELLKREIDYADEITYNAKIIVQKYKCFKNAWYVDFIGLVGIAVLILAA